MCGKNRLKAETQLTLTCATLVTYCFIFSASNMTYHDPRQSVFQQDSRSGLVTQRSIHSPLVSLIQPSCMLGTRTPGGNLNQQRIHANPMPGLEPGTFLVESDSDTYRATITEKS